MNFTAEQRAYYRERYDLYREQGGFLPRRAGVFAWEDTVLRWPELEDRKPGYLGPELKL